MKFKKLVSLSAALGVLTAGTAFAQFTSFTADYSFIVGGYVNTTSSTFGELNASIEVDFLFADDTATELLLTGINVQVTNLGPATSAITGFWLQTPTGGDVMTMSQPTPYTGSTDNWAMTVDSGGDNVLPNYMGGPVDQLGDPTRASTSVQLLASGWIFPVTVLVTSRSVL
ncbi:MAG: hypothetical protein AB3N33_07120 [Puniceicoccaceae bacterium]